MSEGPNSTGNVIAAVCSAIIPGLGQLVQGRILWAIVHVVLGAIIWVITFGWGGWIVHVWSAIDAALYRGRQAAR